MVYGDLHIVDLLVFAGIAAFLIFRLSKVLGKRTGFQKNKENNEKLNYVEKSTQNQIPELKENETKLSLAYESLEDFDHKAFLEGAKYAFESIINAFNNNDTKTLKKLLTNEVYKSFTKAIDEGNNNPNYQFYSLLIDRVENVIIEKNIIKITLIVVSEQFKEDDESTIVKKKDTWTFQKETNNKSPNWYLSAT